MYVYNPSNFSVSYANSAGSATNDSAGRNIAGTYLVRTNGFANGNLCLTKEGDTYPTLSFFSAGFRMHAPFGNKLFLYSMFYNGSSDYNAHIGLLFGDYDTYGTLEPIIDNKTRLGASNKRWTQIYAVNSSISTSDRREKHDISYIGSDSEYDTFMSDEQLIKLIKGIRPVVYRRNNGESGRPHHGLISQDFEDLMHKIGLADHAGFIKSPKTREVEVKDENGEKRMEQEVIEGEYTYGFRYEELIADIIRFCQIQQKQIDEQKKTIQAHENRIRELEDKMDILLSKLA